MITLASCYKKWSSTTSTVQTLLNSHTMLVHTQPSMETFGWLSSINCQNFCLIILAFCNTCNCIQYLQFWLERRLMSSNQVSRHNQPYFFPGLMDRRYLVEDDHVPFLQRSKLFVWVYKISQGSENQLLLSLLASCHSCQLWRDGNQMVSMSNCKGVGVGSFCCVFKQDT